MGRRPHPELLGPGSSAGLQPFQPALPSALLIHLLVGVLLFGRQIWEQAWSWHCAWDGHRGPPWALGPEGPAGGQGRQERVTLNCKHIHRWKPIDKFFSEGEAKPVVSTGRSVGREALCWQKEVGGAPILGHKIPDYFLMSHRLSRATPLPRSLYFWLPFVFATYFNLTVSISVTGGPALPRYPRH